MFRTSPNIGRNCHYVSPENQDLGFVNSVKTPIESLELQDSTLGFAGLAERFSTSVAKLRSQGHKSILRTTEASQRTVRVWRLKTTNKGDLPCYALLQTLLH